MGDQKSLVAVKPTASERPNARKKSHLDLAHDAILAKTLDKSVMAVLAANPMRRWSQNRLAEAVVARPEVDIGSEAMRKWLVRLREDKSTGAHRCFDPMAPSSNGQWLYKKKGGA